MVIHHAALTGCREHMEDPTAPLPDGSSFLQLHVILMFYFLAPLSLSLSCYHYQACGWLLREADKSRRRQCLKLNSAQMWQ